MRELIANLEAAYCGNVGYEFMHIQDRDECTWLRNKIESEALEKFDKAKKMKCLDRLLWSTSFGNSWLEV